MGREQYPIGTIRHWQGGDVIKAHPNNLLHSGWIALQTNETLEAIGRDCDSKANAMKDRKTPINGELFLDREINEFEKDEKGNHPFNPQNFKQYEGFYGAGRYSFRNEFSKRFMADRIKLAEDITNALLKENEAEGGENTGDNKKDVLSVSQKKAVRRRVELDFKYNEVLFTTDDAKQLQGIVDRTYRQLMLGVDFPEGSVEKNAYDNALKVADSFPLKYERIKIKRQLKEETLKEIDRVFKDNWGVRESVRRLLNEKYGEYVTKFAKQISNDEAADQEATFGVKLDDDADTFYKALFKKVKSDKAKIEINYDEYIESRFVVSEDEIESTLELQKDKKDFYLIDINAEDKNDEENKMYLTEPLDQNKELIRQVNNTILSSQVNYPFQELIYLRFETLYKKQLVGNWNIEMLPVIYNIEKFMNELPSGHFKTNNEVTVVSNKDFGDKGYTFYSADIKEISFNDKAANAFQIWGALKGEQEFTSTCSHEIGHAVSTKFGRSSNLDYKKFVVSCGWSYQHLKLSGEHATGDDKDIGRQGSMSQASLLTEYSHKSPEEAFAEYYSIYACNKEAIDNWLKTDDVNVLNKKSQLIVKQKSKDQEKPVSNFYHQIHLDTDSKIGKVVNNFNLDLNDHIKLDLVNPWHVHYTKEQELHLNDSTNVKYGIVASRHDEVMPVIAVKNKFNHYTCLDKGFINEGCKYTKKFTPAIIITEELYHHLSKQFDNKAIQNYVINRAIDEKVPQQSSKPIHKTGIEYRNDIIESKLFAVNKDRMMLMKHIFESKQLQKALSELFSFNKIRSIFAQPTLITNEQGFDEDILKAKVTSLVSEYETCNKEIQQIKSIIDGE
jgi:hypothetical protein